jgi:hypothetical protein
LPSLSGVAVKLLVITAAFFGSEAKAREKIWIYLASCEKFGIEPHLYGCDAKQYPGLLRMRLLGALEYLEDRIEVSGNPEGFTHVLYSDSWDAFFTAPLEDIITKYRNLGSPAVLISGEEVCGNIPDVEATEFAGCFDGSCHYRYPGVFYIAEIPAIIDLMRKMIKRGIDLSASDDLLPWLNAWKEGWIDCMDSECAIFQSISKHVIIRDGKLHNILTGSYPCLYHSGGGYVDPVRGKDDRLVPYATAIGVI